MEHQELTKPTTRPAIDLTFSNVTYTVGSRQILHGVTGSVRRGQILALMGPSGSGKTTLLSILGGKTKGAEGKILFNGLPRTKNLKRLSGFVEQDDILLGALTVRQTLNITATLRLPDELPTERKEARVNEIINELNLAKCANSPIASSEGRISGGERKRTCVGNELLTDPSLLFLDEPTSGLDSTSAFLLMQTMRKLASAGRTIVMSIHQPSSHLYSLFDQLMLLCEGHCVYFGPARSAVPYFSTLGFACPPTYNPADYFMGLVTDASIFVSQEPAAVKQRLISSWKEESAPDHTSSPTSPNASSGHLVKVEVYETEGHVGLTLADRTATHTTHHTHPTPPPSSSSSSATLPAQSAHASPSPLGLLSSNAAATATDDLDTKEDYATGFMTQYMVLLQRAFLVKKDNAITGLAACQFIVLAFIAGGVWFQIDLNEDYIPDRSSVCFFLTLFWTFNPLISSLTTFSMERPIIIKERSRGSYRLSAYFFSKMIADLPIDIFWPSIFYFILYGMTGLNRDPGVFFGIWAAVLLNVMVASGVGLAISARVHDHKKAMVCAAIVVLGYMLTGGFFVASAHIPDFMLWMKYISFIRYTYELILQIEFSTDRTFACTGAGTYTSCPITESDILDAQNVTSPVWLNVVVNVFYVLLLRALSYYWLNHTTKKQGR